MISVGKRRIDLENYASKSEDMRKSLFGYNLDYLDHLNNILAGITIMSYLLYCLSDYALKTLGPNIIYTSPLVIFCIFRYLQLFTCLQKRR